MSVWASSAKEFNDPQDCLRLDVDCAMTPEVLEAQIGKSAASAHPPGAISQAFKEGHEIGLREIQGTFGIVCLTDDPRNDAMWEGYAASCSGFCITYLTRYEPFVHAAKVHYTDDPLKVHFLHLLSLSMEMRLQVYLRSLLKKTTAWQHEREWRIVKTGSNVAIVHPRRAIETIFCGKNMDPAFRRQLEAVASRHELILAPQL